MPLAVKDLFCTKGVPSQSGSKILEGYRPPYTATAVERLQSAGATLLAKTNQDEFAMGSSNENSAYGPVRNPWDRARVPGGSSGGSAAAVAAGLAPWALGTDTGGSIRQPAALCGIVGLKPTYGSVSRYGMIAFASSLDQAGPLTRDVRDAALLLREMVGQDPCDATSLAAARAGRPAERRAPRRGSHRRPGRAHRRGHRSGRAGVVPGARWRPPSQLGAEVREIALPHAPHALSAYYVLAPAEASSNLARFDGVRYGMRAPDARDLLDMYTRTRHDGFGPEVKRRIMLGTYALSSGYYDAYYGRAQRVRTKIAEDFAQGLRAGRPDRHADRAERRVRARREDRRPAGDVPERLLHGADVARRDPGDLDPVRARRRPARRAPARGAGLQRERAARRLPRARAGVRLRRERGPWLSSSPSSAWRSTSSSPRRRRCSAPASVTFGDPPNTHTCPVCLGLPGSLPVANARAVHFGLMIGLALGSELAPRSIFHRKNYFYPDLPKGYQISQYDEPLCRGGHLGDVRIHRVHLEEDAAKLTHLGESGRIHGSDASIVDFNRGGTPLAEIVTEPDLRSAEQAGEWLRLLRTTMRTLGVSDVNMEEGSLRCDANISLRPAGTEQLGVKTELKNMNSFRFIERGIRAEIARQQKVIDGGGTVEQETLHFDPDSGAITSLRSKEEAHDYRYFPEPDLVPVAIEEAMLAGGAGRDGRAAGRARRALRARAGAERGERAAARVPL